jgi:hypothetical protein
VPIAPARTTTYVKGNDQAGGRRTAVCRRGADFGAVGTVGTVGAGVVSGQPSPEEIAQLEALSKWVAGERVFRAIADGDRERALATLPATVELFRDGRDETASRRLLERLPFGDAIGRAAERHRLDGLLLAAVVEVESSFDPRSLSHRGAMGLMQIMPEVASGVVDPFDPPTNLELGARYFSQLLRRFDGDLELALAAYNAGPGAVERFGGVPPYRDQPLRVESAAIYAGHARGAQAPPGSPPAWCSWRAERSRRAVLVLALAGEAVRIVALDALLEVADALAESLAERRQARRAEDHQHDGEDDQQLLKSQSHEGSPRRRRCRRTKQV